jgi:hypothetical protein
LHIKRSHWLLIGLGMAGAFIFGLLNPDPAPRGSFLIQLAGALMLTVAIHELGHVVAGWLVGFRLVHVSVGPLLVSHYTERFKLHWWLIHSRAMGFASMVPPPGSGQYWRMAVVIAGGPTASGICAYCFTRLQSQISESSPFNGFAGVVALTSLVIGVIISTIPARAGPLRTDCALLRSLFLGG